MDVTTSKRCTIAGIARASGCSKAVVSTVLNGSRGNTVVGAELRARVERMARELGYVPNHASQSLATGSSMTVGVFITPGPWFNVGSEYESGLLRGVDRACQAAGFDLVILNIAGRQTVADCVRKVAAGRLDGVVLLRAAAGSDALIQLSAACDNLVAADYNEPEPRALSATGFDNAAAMRLAVEHLVSLGHRRIGYVGGGGPMPVPDDRARRAGFAAAMNAASLPIEPHYLFYERQDSSPAMERTHAQAWGWDAADQVLALGAGRPTALVIWSDSVAVTVMQRLAQKGLSVPGQMSLVGVDNSPSCQIVWPQLTSVDHPLVDIGAEATSMLIEGSRARRDRLDRRPQRVIFQPKLVVRGTTGPVRHE